MSEQTDKPVRVYTGIFFKRGADGWCENCVPGCPSKAATSRGKDGATLTARQAFAKQESCLEQLL